jgi:uncharacterized iron-regulated protein
MISFAVIPVIAAALATAPLSTLLTPSPTEVAAPLVSSGPSAPAAATVALDTVYEPGEYRVFTGAGQPATLDDVVAAMANHQVVFIGETHDDPTAHALQARLLERAWESYHTPSPAAIEARTVALSLEFFERDVQLVLNEYLADLITESAFLAASRPWPRYETDIRPLVEFSKAHGLPVIAANAPRRYATRVTRHGRESLEDLPARALDYLPPLPYPQPSQAYRDQWIAVMANVMRQEGTRCGIPVDHPPAPVGAHAQMGNQLHTQTLWDASMAWSIARHLEAHPGALVLHLVGGFHVARGTGTPELLQLYLPGASHMIVVIRPVEDPDAFEPAPAGEWGDFVIQTERARTLEAIECRAILEAHGVLPPASS